jgi:predicted  nucleic acid-binding Zn-ribbon protein
MRIRGERECTDCGTRWSYYETGTPNCPNCGSLRSTGVGERTQHTASTAELDLSAARNRLGDGEEDVRAAAERAAEDCRAFTRQHGFIDAGDLAPLDDIYVGALELRTVADELGRAMRTSDAEEAYFLALLNVDDGERPAPTEVPESLRTARGLAAAKAVREYRSDVSAYLDDHPDEDARTAFGTLGEHVKRVEALDGDVSPATADRLVRVARELGTYLRTDDENALVTARDRLSRLG